MPKHTTGGKYTGGPKLEPGPCTYCRKFRPLTNDHALPRSTFPEFRTHPDNLVPACWPCNLRREEKAWRPSINLLPPKAKSLVLAQNVGRVERYFTLD